MHIKQFTFNHFQVNCYLVWDAESRCCAIVDPGMEATYEDAQLSQFIEQNGLAPVHVLVTHPHVDHIAGLRQVCERYQLPATLHPEGTHLLKQAEVYSSVMGFDIKNLQDLPQHHINDRDILSLAPQNADKEQTSPQIEVRFVPGHCPGSVAYVLHEDSRVITGDALFHGSIGRTDFPGGNYATLIHSLSTQILTLPDDYEVLPGHGDLSTVGEERLYNGFLQGIDNPQ